jgi:hypothetical protein
MRQRLELTLVADPSNPADRENIAASAEMLLHSLHPEQWAILELLSLAVERLSAVDRETRRQLLHLPHRI